jgi:ABC-type uncharacterized transport system substrate-binding protein
VGVVFNPETAPFAPLFWQPVVDVAARSFAVAAVQIAVRDGRALAVEIETFAGEPDGGLMVLPDVSTANNRDLIIALAARHRLPAVYPYRYFAASGGLFSYGSDVADVFRRAASYVDRVLKGAKPADLPVMQPSKFELVINLKFGKLPVTIAPPADDTRWYSVGPTPNRGDTGTRAATAREIAQAPVGAATARC